ncbi:MAG: family 43 glycosylhydrolase [Clostridiales bacterium]|nr:family 43 glycosylhydrolase [Clostridiales bacterium]
MSQMIELINNQNLDEIKKILEVEPKRINEEDENGVPMSFYIARTGNIKMVKYLVEYTIASFNVGDRQHRTILHEAVEAGSLECVKYLVERVGISPCEGDKNLVTPYQIAHENGFKDIEKYFEEYTGAKYEDMYHNPIRTGFFADPSIVRVGSDYYMVNSSFTFFPCIPISHSTDLVNWKVIGHAITNPEWANIDDLEGGRGYWAPDISYYNGKFYITATLRYNDTGKFRRQIVVSSEKPEGPYSKPAFIEEDGIDPSIFTDVDGRRYMLLNRGARIFELNADCTEQISDAELLFYGDNKRAPEGPHLLYKDGYYYLFEAEGGTGLMHQITVSRSKTLKGVYEPCPYNPIMTQKDYDAAITCCGHGKPVQTQNGDWYIVYLCNRLLDGQWGMLGRETCLDPITWTADGWPVINNLNGPSSLQKKPALPATTVEPDGGFDDFDGDKIKPYWIFARTPETDGIKVENSRLYIKGSKEPLSSMFSKNITVQRQKDFNFDVIAKLDLGIELKNNQNYGITGYYDENTYFTYGIYKNGDSYALKLFEKIDEDEKYTYSVDIPGISDSVYLKITTEGLKRTFFYSFDGKTYTEIGTVENLYYLCSQAIQKGKRFTGAMIGMYAYSGDDTPIYASFDSFEYISK